MGSIPRGADLVEAITVIANEESIRTAAVRVFGEVSKVSITRFDQESKFQDTVEHEGSFTIAALSGTISIFKRRSLARLSGVFSASDGQMLGGNVTLGTTVYACEVVIQEIEGASLSRDFDMQTGLPLWKGAALFEE